MTETAVVLRDGTEISWCHFTHNPWWGCSKISPACVHCYAETWAKRTGNEVWGDDAPRRMLSDANWRKPLKWNREAEALGVRYRVFCASMADVFEDRDDLDGARARLWDLIEATPHLDWLLLTKRPQNIMLMTPIPWRAHWPAHVWVGTTVENQAEAEKRVPHLVQVPARVRFISAEPLLGPLELGDWFHPSDPSACADPEHCSPWGPSLISWVIAGGESGGHARPTHPTWFRQLLNDCEDNGVPFHFKQHGEWIEADPDQATHVLTYSGRLRPRLGAPLEEFRRDGGAFMLRAGKKHTGRKLGGITYDGFPS